MSDVVRLGGATLYAGDCRDILKSLPAESVHCCVTSPPYYGLRDYGCADQIGLEQSPQAYIAALVDVFREVRRVLRKDGTVWLNMGDSYAGSWGNQGRRDDRGSQRPINGPMLQTFEGYPDRQPFRAGAGSVAGLKPKDLIGIPWMLAFALRDDGWYLRRDIIWHKPNPMPESVRDRCTSSHEYLFHLSKAPAYFYDAEAIKEPAETALRPSVAKGGFAGKTAGTDKPAFRAVTASRNKRSVWTVTSAPFKGAHFATFPPKLIKPCILAGTSARGVCPKCLAPWARVVRKRIVLDQQTERQRHLTSVQVSRTGGTKSGGKNSTTFGLSANEMPTRDTIGWRPTCCCEAGYLVPATLLDPFGGAATTALVAERLGLRSISIELSQHYHEIARRRIEEAQRVSLAA